MCAWWIELQKVGLKKEKFGERKKNIESRGNYKREVRRAGKTYMIG